MSRSTLRPPRALRGSDGAGRRPARSRASAVATALLAALLAAGVPAPATAATAATTVATAATTVTDLPTATSDALPTVQINGVAWAQVVVGDTVYVAGSFTSARPAGSPAGQNETPRASLLAYDIRTGALIPSWAPALNGPAFAIAASPDGRTIYVGGDFTAVDGTTRSRFAAIDATTGALNSQPRLSPNNSVRAIAASATTVYLGGNFTYIGSTSRPRVAAVNATTGALTSFTANVQSAQVDALLLTADGSKLVLGGRFKSINGVTARGTGWVDATTGATLAFPANQVVQNYGYSAGIFSLSQRGDRIFATAWHRLDNGDGSVGNLEGMFAANASTGRLEWVEDCKGDSYSTYPSPDGHVYLAGHPHDCAPAGAFPEVSPRVHLYALAFTQDARLTTAQGSNTHHAGRPSPALANWFPTLSPGGVTGQNQAGWSVVGNGDYVAYGGEFPRVNGVAQAGLVRFAARSVAPAKRGPVLNAAAMTPSAVSRAAGTAQVSWPVNHDPDDGTLTYRLIRNGNTANPVATVVHESRYWDRGRLSATDTGLSNNTSYSYTVQTVDSAGNTVTSQPVSVTTASSGTLSPYARTVLSDSPTNYWRLGDTGSTIATWSGANPGTSTGATRVTGGIAGDSDGALRFAGTSASSAASGTAEASKNELSIEAWFSTTSTRGGKIVGFGSARTGASGSFDRHIVMGDDGRLRFGVNPRALKVVTSPAAYNDGAWHHVVATLGTTGMKLYVDGALVASDPTVSTGQNPYSGYWRIGGDSLATWDLGATSEYFDGVIDEVATYSEPLSAERVALHHSFGATGSAPKLAPTATFSSTADRLTVALDGSGSTDPDGTVTGHAWDFGDGATGTGATTTHTYAAAGTYQVTLTVTDNDGVRATTTKDVEVITGLPTAAFTSTTSGLAVSVDASSSTDPDGTLTYAWDFGGGATATGVTATHRFAAAGTYPVTLTVTDNHRQTSTVTRSVTVSAEAKVLGRDAFGRTSTSGWGSAEVGGAWTVTSGVSTTDGSTGVHTLAKANSAAGARLPGAAGTTTVTQVSTSLDKMPNGSGLYSLVRARITSTDDAYRLKLQYRPDGQVRAWWTKSVAGTETVISSTSTAPVTYRAGEALITKVAAVGANPTRLQAKVWLEGTPEPANWLFDFTDASPTIQTTGHVGVYGQLSSTTTNGPVAVRYDDLLVTDGGQSAPAPTQAPPTASFTSTVADLTASVDGSASADTDGTIASWAWSFGDGTAGTGRTASHTYTAAGTYPVTLTVTDDDGLTATVTRDVTVKAPAQAPTASFTSSATDLTVSVDGSGSTDADGTIASYAWTFGDGRSGTGRTATHTYTAAGTYPVTLTVTDNDGRTGTVTRDVTVKAGAQAPTASFTSSAADLTLSVDGSGSSDPDGTIASYAWAFGDGGSGSGRTASHTYKAEGSYPVTLTVTDSSGLTATTTRTVSVTAPVATVPEPEPGATVVGQDAFGRTVSSGWGSADVGGAWTASSTVTSVSGGQGLFSLARANSAAAARLPGVAGTDLVTQVTMSLDKVPNGSGMYSLVRARITSTDDAYRLKLQHQSNGQVRVWWTKSVAGTETVISTYLTAPVTYGPGTVLVVKAAATGTSPTRLQSKVWVQGTTEPAGWLHDFTDSSTSLQTSGHVGVWAMLAGNLTNGPVQVRYDDLLVTRAAAQ